MEHQLHEILISAKKDAWYQDCLAKVKVLEPEFQEIRTGLSPKQQELLDRSIAACEAMDDALLALAIRQNGE